MNRDDALNSLHDSSQVFDIIVIGGGATGLGAALDATSRGYKTLLLEQHDFAKGTSSRSTKLIHGGIRYLRQGNVSLVMESLHERGLLCKNAPHLVRPMPFVIPLFRYWEIPFFGAGLKLYDQLAGKRNIGKSKFLSNQETRAKLPNVRDKNLKLGIQYFDAQFDDTRLAINLAQTISDYGGLTINYAKVTGLLKTKGKVSGVQFKDYETNQTYEVQSKAIINATGIFSDSIRKMDDPKTDSILSPSQGAHIVIPKSYFPSDHALMIPKTEDGRVLFCIPWYENVIVGTTDIGVKEPVLEPKPLESEITFLLKHLKLYLLNPPKAEDIKSAFAGQRPLIQLNKSKHTSALPRDHTILISDSGLITIAGGKWTTYRKMAEDVVNEAQKVANLKPHCCITESLKIHGHSDEKPNQTPPHFNHYGSEAKKIKELAQSDPELANPIHPKLPYWKAEVLWATRNEMARTPEDILTRRTRALYNDATATIEAIPEVTRIMADELNRDDDWKNTQIHECTAIAQRYQIAPNRRS